MTNSNEHIEEFLETYYTVDREPGYAVLLKGKWGTGKTWFIKRTLEKFKEQDKGEYLYVSLNGLATLEEIDDEFFKILHPVLSSKSMNIAGKIAKWLLKTSLKIDFDSKNDSVTVSPQMPNFELPDFLKDKSKRVIVFDDLERASIPLDRLLGYINHFVEQQGHKVIIVANEDELFSKEQENKDKKQTKDCESDALINYEFSSSTSYRRIKGKLIGKTFEVSPDLTGALNNFIQDIKLSKAKTFYEANIKTVTEIYNDSEYKNLRHLKQTLWDFERFISYFSRQAQMNPELLKHLLKIYLILAFEIKSGNILPSDITEFSDLQISVYKAKNNKDEQQSTIYKIFLKYKSEELFDFILEHSIWENIFDKGLFDKNAINLAIDNSKYFKEDKIPNWVVAYNARKITEQEFDLAIKSIENDLALHDIKEIGVIKHIAGIYLWLSKENVLNKTKSEIVKEILGYVDYLYDNNFLLDDDVTPFRLREKEAWAGFGYMERETPEFIQICDYIETKINSSITNEYPILVTNLLELMKKDAQAFFRTIVFNDNSENKYICLPIFSYISPELFVAAYMSTPPSSRRFVDYTFSGRYKQQTFNTSLALEIPWLEKFIELLKIVRQDHQGKLLGLQISESLDYHFVLGLNLLTESLLPAAPSY